MRTTTETTEITTPHCVGATYDDVEGHFDLIAKKYDSGSEKAAWKGANSLTDLFTIISPVGLLPLRSLDIGTGTGKVAEILKAYQDATSGVTITGTDIAQEMLDSAKHKGVLDHAQISDATDLSWANDSSYDAVTSCGVLDFVEDTESFANEAMRVVRPQGVAIFTYEPAETLNPGHKTIQHYPEALSNYFRSAGGIILMDRQCDAIYNNFARGRAPVTNHIMAVVRAR